MNQKDYEAWKPAFSTAQARTVAERMIDEGPFGNLLLIADTYEEEGQIEIAEGYRWLVTNHRQPCCLGERDTPYWTFTYDEQTEKIWSYLPVEASSLMKVLTPNVSISEGPATYNYFPNYSTAYYAAAACMGVVLWQPRILETLEERRHMTDRERNWASIPDNLKHLYPSMKVEVPLPDDLRARAAESNRRLELLLREMERRQFLDQREAAREKIRQKLERKKDLTLYESLTQVGEPGIMPPSPYPNPCSEVELPILFEPPFITKTTD